MTNEIKLSEAIYMLNEIGNSKHTTKSKLIYEIYMFIRRKYSEHLVAIGYKKIVRKPKKSLTKTLKQV
jgi:hypothetical protein